MRDRTKSNTGETSKFGESKLISTKDLHKQREEATSKLEELGVSVFMPELKK